MSNDQLYVLGYAYGWHQKEIPAVYLTLDNIDSLLQGTFDGGADRDNDALPVADFEAGRHFQREIGTIITCMENVAVSPGDIDRTIYIVGDFPDVGKIRYQSIEVCYAMSDRTWMSI